MYMNADAMTLRQPPATPDQHQGKMLSQQQRQDIEEHGKARVGQGIVAEYEMARGGQMNFDSAAAHADALALNTKAAVMEQLGMKGVPLPGMSGIRAATQGMIA
jgi:hypothetical protein